MSVCRSCRASVRWVQTQDGKAMPLDPEPRDDGNIVFTRERAMSKAGTPVPVVAYLAQDSLALPGLAEPDRYVSHFATCPDSDSWRNA